MTFAVWLRPLFWRSRPGRPRSIHCKQTLAPCVFSSALRGVVVGVGNGKGTLTFHGKTYPFEVSGASVGPMLALTVSELEGRAVNLRTPGDLAGNYIAVGAGGAIVGGIGVARLRNANGVILVVRGPKLGAGLSVNLARVTITMM